MAKIEILRTGNKMVLASGDINIEFDVRFGEKNYPFNCALYNIRLSDNLISEIESSKIVKVDTDLCVVTEPTPDPSFAPLFECGTDLFIVPLFGYSTDKLTAVFHNILKRLKYESEN